jgi:hypothetical protein
LVLKYISIKVKCTALVGPRKYWTNIVSVLDAIIRDFPMTYSLHSQITVILASVIPDFKDKTRYTPYVSLRSQISHIAINEG